MNEINKIKDYFNYKKQERKATSKKLSKYTAAFDYIDKTLIILSATSGGISNVFYKCYWSSCRNSKCKFYFNIFSNFRNNKETEKITRNKKKKHNKIVLLAKSKLNSIENLVPQALIDLGIANEEFNTSTDENRDLSK